ncbi:hypothetical protein CTAYLR_001172 [Chrysophaeum taylorii]|uniref:MOSC domain-containing protein n=1 Tax=Chrysophaeum taylorii TaxID=2483200 RepID=A0AAD7UP48_9STRA|nr:hypothetical protein CTAYLR_001172 [Chrysophaeum taylorii]
MIVVVYARREKEDPLKASFLRRAGSRYGYGGEACGHIDRWRSREFPGLGHYLDYAGAGVASASQIASIAKTPVLGNPHTIGPSSDESVRRMVADRFGARGYGVAWTSGATEALRIVAEFADSPALVYGIDSHTSVVGMRRVFLERGARVFRVRDWKEAPPGPGLAVVTLESNASGERWDVVADLRQRGWLVCADAAKLASTATLDIAALGSPDFVAVSFYKLFGAPTGLGALLASPEGQRLLTLSKRDRGYFGGGAVDRVSVTGPDDDWTVVRSDFEAAMEDGTPHFRGIAHLVHGFRELDRVGGPDRIEQHAGVLADELADRLLALSPRARVYPRRRGSSIVLFNVFRDDNKVLSPSAICGLLADRGILVRAGCVCNVGACGLALELSHADIVRAWTRGAACGGADDVDPDGRPLGLLRASFGKDSVWEDLHALCAAVETLATTRPMEGPGGPYRLDEIKVYPVKGCRALENSSSTCRLVDGRLEFDRRWAILDDRLGHLVAAKSHPAVARIRVALRDDRLLLSTDDDDDGIAVPTTTTTSDEVDRTTVRVCGETTTAFARRDPRISRFFSRALLGIDDGSSRFRLVEGFFANSAPLLLVSRRSVDRLNRALRDAGEPPVTADHFRPNLVVSDLLPPATDHPEDHWTSLDLPDARLRVSGPCDRCAAIDVDPLTAQRTSNALKVLTAYRRDARAGRVTFGVFLELDDDEEGAPDHHRVVHLRRGTILHPRTT